MNPPRFCAPVFTSFCLVLLLTAGVRANTTTANADDPAAKPDTAAPATAPAAKPAPHRGVRDWMLDKLPRPWGEWKHDQQRFLTGAATGLVLHESGHVIANFAVGSTPRVESVHYGPIPFFTWEPDHKLSDRDHYITASAGFNMQAFADEWILTRHPNLKDENEPRLKGLLTFNYWLSAAYAATAFAKSGPHQGDTRGMADSARIGESTIGALVLAPALLDAYRYHHPDAKWARFASRLTKLAMIGLVVRARP